MAYAYILGGIGMLCIAYGKALVLLLFGVICIGICYSISSVTVHVLISVYSQDRLVDFAKEHTITNIATMVGPLGFNALYVFNARLPFFLWGIFLFLCALYSIILPIQGTIPPQERVGRSLLYLLKNINAVVIALCVLTGWLFYNCVMTFSSIALARFFDLEKYIWTIATCNGLVVALFGILTNKFLKRRLSHPYQNIILGYLLFLACFLLLYFTNTTFLMVLVAVILVSVAELIIVPAWQTLASVLIDQQYRVAMISISTIFFASGEGLGQVIGVLITDNFVVASTKNHAFIILAGVALALLFAIWFVILKKTTRIDIVD